MTNYKCAKNLDNERREKVGAVSLKRSKIERDSTDVLNCEKAGKQEVCFDSLFNSNVFDRLTLL